MSFPGEQLDALEAPGFVVETPACDAAGNRVGTMRHYVPTRERAVEEAAKVPERTWREIPFADMKPEAQEEMRKHRAMVNANAS